MTSPQTCQSFWVPQSTGGGESGSCSIGNPFTSARGLVAATARRPLGNDPPSGSPVPTAGDTQASVTLKFTGAVLMPDDGAFRGCRGTVAQVTSLADCAAGWGSLSSTASVWHWARFPLEAARVQAGPGMYSSASPLLPCTGHPLARQIFLANRWVGLHLGGIPNWLEVPGKCNALCSAALDNCHVPGADFQQGTWHAYCRKAPCRVFHASPHL